MAEGLLRVTLPECHAWSAGLGALVGYPADRNARELMQKIGLDISGHRAAMVAQQDCQLADVILVMDAMQEQHLKSIFPFSRGKIFRLGQYGDYDIFDPYMQGAEEFERCFQLIERGVEEWARRIRTIN
jgi:protein-tyrosine phosphatase